jgi:superfamily I DNA/RNA helicase
LSQHIIEEDGVKWVFGWDHPLQTFFLQKHDLTLEDEDDNPVVWLGANGYKDRMYEVSDLVIAAKKHGLKIPYATQVVLYRDKDYGV